MKRPERNEYAEYYEGYVSAIGETDIVSVLCDQAHELRSAFAGIPEEKGTFSYAEGKWTNGPLHGWIYFVKNTGTTAEPKYAEPKFIDAGGKRLDTYGCPSPNFEDFDKDGMTDILLPLETGTVNTTWAVWRQVAEGKFVRVGEPSGVSIVKTDSGYIAVQGRSSAAEYYVDFYKLEADNLKRLVTARVAAAFDDTGEKVVGSECTLEDADGLSAMGLTPEAAKVQFCAEPVVDGLVKDMTADQ